MTKRLATFAWCSLWLSLSSTAASQPTTTTEAPAPAAPKPLADALGGEARAAYESAKLLLQNHDAAGAVAKFQRAYALSGDARLLWNIAACEKEQRHYASASRFVGRYLNEGGQMLAPENRQSAEAAQRALRAFYSELTLEGVPAGANVSIDDAPAGVVPFSEPLLVDLGRRRLRIDADGYEAFSRLLEVPGATPVSVSVTLVRKKQTASLSITTAEARAVIALDGAVVGSQHWLGSVPAGSHVVRVTARDKKPYETTLQLTAGSSRSLQIALQDDAHAKPLWPWIAGGAALLVGASIGGYFALKGNDARGPTPNGELGNVQLPLIGAGR